MACFAGVLWSHTLTHTTPSSLSSSCVTAPSSGTLALGNTVFLSSLPLVSDHDLWVILFLSLQLAQKERVCHRSSCPFLSARTLPSSLPQYVLGCNLASYCSCLSFSFSPRVSLPLSCHPPPLPPPALPSSPPLKPSRFFPSVTVHSISERQWRGGVEGSVG